MESQKFSVERVRQLRMMAMAHETVCLLTNDIVDERKGDRMLGPVLVRLGWKTRSTMPTELITIPHSEREERDDIADMLILNGESSNEINQEQLLTMICNRLLVGRRRLVKKLDRHEILETVRRMIHENNIGSDVWLITFATHIKNRAIELGCIVRSGRTFSILTHAGAS